MMYEATDSWSTYTNWLYNPTNVLGNATKNSRTSSICQATKDAGVIIFTIGFEADADGDATLLDCASSASHFYDVEGLEISEAFAAIATQINQLKLVQ